MGGFFHSYVGQEAIQTAAVAAFGQEQWWVTTYRCHALALLLGSTPNELMAELFGKATGNAKGRGGSMHFFAERLLGGFGIVGGQIPIATGAAFALQYQKRVPKVQGMKRGDLSICFLGDGAVAQGAFHESLNLASLWDLPCLYVIENNQWGMGTHVSRALSMEPIAERIAPAFQMESYMVDGMDFFNCYAAFKEILGKMKQEGRPILVEVVTERFKGHSISDVGAYRSKEALELCMQRDPLVVFFKHLERAKLLTEAEYRSLEGAQKETIARAVQYADESPDPSVMTLEEDVFAPSS